MTKTTITIPCEHFKKEALLFYHETKPIKAAILYFHGGGFLYGNKDDLPDFHLESLTNAGFAIVSYDYPLAPASDIEDIVTDIASSITHFCNHKECYFQTDLPYYLWGRSAGAYLCSLTAAIKLLPKIAKGIISYYGYGFLCDTWFEMPASYYTQLPTVDSSILTHLPNDAHCDGALDTHYSAYVYARQTGNWISLIFNGKAKDFLLQYSLRTVEKLPCPIFCAHSTVDPDVPYDEFLALCQKYQAKRFVASEKEHDFDRNTSSFFTKLLLKETVLFLEEHLNPSNTITR